MTDAQIGELDESLQIAKKKVSLCALACLRSSPDAWALVRRALDEIESVRQAMWRFRVDQVVAVEEGLEAEGHGPEGVLQAEVVGEVPEGHPKALRLSEGSKTVENGVFEGLDESDESEEVSSR